MVHPRSYNKSAADSIQLKSYLLGLFINQYLIPEYPHLVKRRKSTEPCILEGKGATDGGDPKGFICVGEGGTFLLEA